MKIRNLKIEDNLIRMVLFLQDMDIIRYMEIRAAQVETEILPDHRKTETVEAVSGKKQAVRHFWQ